MKKRNITIVGGSNSAHTLIPLLTHAGHNVDLLTRNPSKWSKEITMKYILCDGSEQSRITGSLNRVSSNPEDVIPEADIVILSLPVSSYREVLHNIAPYLRNSPDVFVGTIYGQGGFNWMVDEIKKKFKLPDLNYFAVGLIPWITRTEFYGETGINYGPKAVNVVAISDPQKFDSLNSEIFDDLCYNFFKKGKFVLSSNFLSLSLSVDNQIIHLARLFGMYLKFGGVWKERESVPLFYRDFDDLSANLMNDLDADYTLIRNEIINKYPQHDFKYMLDYLDLERLSYSSANSDIKESFITSETLGQIPTPTMQNEDGDFVYDPNHRFFLDDLYFGLIIAKWFAEEFKIETHTIDKIINWAQEIVGEDVLNDGSLIPLSEDQKNKFKYGAPPVYGFTNLDELIA